MIRPVSCANHNNERRSALSWTTFFPPTCFVFGKEAEKNAGKYVKRFGGTKVLIHYGGGSVSLKQEDVENICRLML